MDRIPKAMFRIVEENVLSSSSPFLSLTLFFESKALSNPESHRLQSVHLACLGHLLSLPPKCWVLRQLLPWLAFTWALGI